jgi:serine/threonine protein kinase
VANVTAPYCAPELFTDATRTAAFPLDLFSLGRIIHWLTTTNKDTWETSKSSNAADITDQSVQDIVTRLTQVKVEDRLTLAKLKESRFMVSHATTPLNELLAPYFNCTQLLDISWV